MSNKLHDLLRTLQWLIPAVVTLLGAFDKAFSWGIITTVETLASAVVAFIGVIAQHSSATYFSTKSIVTKILPDKEVETEEE